ncbi:MAG: hypothetical protein AAF799_18275 [Myxococcota bacterium]
MAEPGPVDHESEPAESWGLHACGRDGDVEIELLESVSRAKPTWEVQLTVGMFDVGCRIDSPANLRRLSEFFEQTFRNPKHRATARADGTWRYADERAFELGTTDGRPLSIIKDGKYDDRYFVVLGVERNYLRFTPTLEQTLSLMRATRQLVAELEI